MCFAGNVSTENCHGLCVLSDVQSAVGAPESAAAVERMREVRNRGITQKAVGADKGYHTKEFVTGLSAQGMVSHPARKDSQKTLRVLLTLAQAVNQKFRKRIEEIFGLTKMTSGVRKSPYHGVERTYAPGQYVVAAWNLMRMAKLLVSGPPKVSRA